MINDLDIARQMAAAGAPVFRLAQGEFPTEWQYTKPDPRVVDSLNPGDGAAVVTGHLFDVIDFDTKHPHFKDEKPQELLTLVQRCQIGVVQSKSGGWHAYIPPLELGVRKLAPGIELRGKNPDKGHCAHIPPSVRWCEHTQKYGQYKWIQPLDLERLHVVTAMEASWALKALISGITQHRGMNGSSGDYHLGGENNLIFKFSQMAIDAGLFSTMGEWQRAMLAFDKALDHPQGEERLLGSVLRAANWHDPVIPVNGMAWAQAQVREPEPVPDQHPCGHRTFDVRCRACLDARDAAARAGDKFMPPPASMTLRDRLEAERPVRIPLISGLAFQGQVISLAAMYKTGKTRLLCEAAGSLADGRPFLGQFATHLPEGNIGIWNAEMLAEDLDDFFRLTKVSEQRRIVIADLKSTPLPLARSEAARDWARAWLEDNDIRVLMQDSWTRFMAWSGLSMNTEADQLCAVMDELLGGRTFLTTAHMPHAAKIMAEAERAIGSQYFSAWTDVNWLYVKAEGGRFLRAEGRGAGLDESKVTLGADGRLTAESGNGREEAASATLREAILTFIGENPGCSGNALINGVGGNQQLLGSVLAALRKEGKVYTEKGPRNANLHYLTKP